MTEANLDEWQLEARFTNPLCPARPALGLPAGVYCTGDEAAASRDAAGIQKQFLEWIDAAGRLKQEQPDREVKITVAYMSFSDAAYKKALCEAAARGVEIFGVFDKRNGGSLPNELASDPACGPERIRMVSLGGQTDSLETWRIFHMKMMLIEDGGPTTRLVFGSPNLYEGGYSTWFESWVFATLPSDARFIEEHRCTVRGLEDAAAAPAGEDANAFIARFDACVANIDAPPDDRLRVFFSPDPDSAGLTAARKMIQQASSSVDTAVYLLSSGALARSLVDAAARPGVRARLVLDDATVDGNSDGPHQASHNTWKQVLRPGIQDTRFMATNASIWQLMHHKFIVADDARVFMGGGHFTTSAFKTNYESFYLLDVPEIGESFAREFDRMYELAQPEPKRVPAGVYLLRTSDGRCLDVWGANQADGATTTAHPCNQPMTDNQRFTIEPQSDATYLIKAVHSGKCLDQLGPSTTAGGQLGQWACHAGANQRFFLTARGDRWVLAPQHSLLCMAPGGDPPTPVAQGDCGSAPPEWTLEPAP